MDIRNSRKDVYSGVALHTPLKLKSSMLMKVLSEREQHLKLMYTIFLSSCLRHYGDIRHAPRLKGVKNIFTRGFTEFTINHQPFN